MSSRRPIRFSGPVVDLVPMMPIELHGDVMRAVATACERRGLECYFHVDKPGRIYVKPKEGS